MVAREALELHRPQLTPCNVRSGYESLHHTGCQNLAACLRGYPRRHDYVAPEEVFAFFDHLAGVEADPNLHRLCGALVSSNQHLLNSRRACQRLPRALKGDHKPVALALHLEAAVSLDLLAYDRIVFAEEFHEPRVAEPVGHGGGAFDIAEHDRDGTVRRGVRLEIGLVLEHLSRDGIDRSADVAKVSALCL